MEILHDSTDKRTILVALDDYADHSRLYPYLCDTFHIIREFSADKCLDIMRERKADLSAVVIDIDMAKADEFRFLRSAKEEGLLDITPVVIASRRPLEEGDMRCFQEGAVDVMAPPYFREVAIRRVENAIHVMNSTTFCEIESILRELPSNIFMVDTECRYVFATHYWRHIRQSDDPNWTVRGKTDLEIRRDYENAVKAYESDMEVMRTGVGQDYVIEVDMDGIVEYLEIIKRPVYDEEGNVKGVVVLANDVTETELIKRELEQHARTDKLTGLGNRRAFDAFVSGIPERDDFPIAIISADCDGLKTVNDTFGHLVGDEYIRLSATVLKTILGDEARAFRIGGDEFLAFLPKTSEEQAASLVRAMRAQSNLFKIHEHAVSVSYGIASIDSRDADVLEAIEKADRSMYSNKVARNQARRD